MLDMCQSSGRKGKDEILDLINVSLHSLVMFLLNRDILPPEVYVMGVLQALTGFSGAKKSPVSQGHPCPV